MGGKEVTWQDHQRSFELLIMNGRQPDSYRESTIESLEAILDRYADKKFYGYNKISPQFRNWMVKAWAQQHRYKCEAQNEVSIDEYARTLADNVCTRYEAELAVPLLRALAEELELQRDTSYYVQEKLEKNGLLTFNEKEVSAIFSEELLVLAGTSPEFRDSLLTFLCNPFSKESSAAFKIEIEKLGSDLEFTLNHELVMSAGRNMDEALRLVYDTFSSWPLELQALSLDKIIFPVEDKLAQAGAETIDVTKESERILLQVFPENIAYSRQIRDFFRCYMNTQEETGQRLITAILMAYSREQNMGVNEGIAPERQIGRTLGYVLGRMHPIGAILAQELESYPNTDERIRQGLKEMDVKAGVDLPDRWTLWHIIDDATDAHPEVLENKKVKEMLGGGSAQLNVRLRPKEGEDEALTLLRPFVSSRGERQYDDIKKAFTEFVKTHPKYQPLAGVIDAAYEKLGDETNYSNSQIQADNAQKLFEGFEVYSGGVNVDFDAVDFKGNGKSWRLYDVAEGTHFNDLPAITPDQIKVKKAVAKSIVTNGLSGMLRGMAANSDMHGKQQKIRVMEPASDGTIDVHVTNFDYGGVALSAPSDAQKNVLGEFLGKVLSKSMVDKLSLEKAVSEVTKDYADSEHTQYIETSKRTLRTLLGDYVNALAYPSSERIEPTVGGSNQRPVIKRGKPERLLSESDISAVFYAVLNDKKADKAITGPMRAEVTKTSRSNWYKGSVLRAAMGGFGAQLGGRSAVTIKDGPGTFASRVTQPSNDRYVG